MQDAYLYDVNANKFSLIQFIVGIHFNSKARIRLLSLCNVWFKFNADGEKINEHNRIRAYLECRTMTTCAIDQNKVGAVKMKRKINIAKQQQK